MGCTSRFDRIRRGLCVTFLPLALAVGIGPASAEKVGVAAAVNPDAFSSRGGQLNIGNSIFFNERISTTGSGLVQVLLVDGSTFTVGPGSDLVIDKFVYNPKKETGQVVATFSKGAMRYVGGKISKNTDGVTIKTPTGSLAVRGGMVQGIVSGKTILFSFLFGKEMVFIAANGKTYTVFQPGYTLDLSGGVINVRPTTAADIARVMALLTNSDTSAIGQSDDEEGEGVDAVTVLATISNEMAELISDATANRIQATLQEQLLLMLEDDVAPIPLPDNLSGYAAATMISVSHPGTATQLVRTSLSDFALFYNGQTGSAQLLLREAAGNDGAVSAYGFNVPIGPTQAGLPGHIGDMGATVFDDAGQPYPQTSSSGAFFIGNPNGGSVLCTKCSFMRWGVVGSNVSFGGNSTPTQFQDTINGFWVAGDVPIVDQLPSSGSATYVGSTLGTAAYRSSPSASWQPRVAYGDVNMSWNFASRTGNLAISNFDRDSPIGPQNYSGTMSMTGSAGSRNMFGGSLGGSGTGAAIGSFTRNGRDAAGGVLGNWLAGSGNYRATGIFGAAR